MPQYVKILLNVISACSFLSIWLIITHFQLVNPLLLPSPQAVWQAFINLFLEDDLAKHLQASFWRYAIGLISGIIIGVFSGVMLGSWKPLYQFFELPVEFLRSIPQSALLPLVMLIFGIGEGGKIFLVAFSVSLVVLINTLYGIMNIKGLD